MTRIEQLKTEIHKSTATNTHIFFFVYLASMIALLFLRNALNVNIPPVLFLLLTLIPLALGDVDDILAVAVCCIPFSTGFQYKYALLLGIVALLFKTKFKVRFTPVMGVVICMMIWELLHAFYGTFSFVEYFRSFAELLFLAFAVSCVDKEKINHKFILRAYSVALIGVCFIMLYLQLSQNNFDLNEVLTRSKYSRFGRNNTSYIQYGLNFNPNGLGFMCDLSLASCLFLISRKENSIFNIVLLALSAVFAFMTLSRSAIVCMLFFVFSYVFFANTKGVKKLKYVFFTISCLLILFISIYSFMPEIFGNIIERFSESDVTGGRSDLFEFYNEHIASSVFYMFFGVGLQDFAGKMINIYGGSYNDVPHNGCQEAIVCWGVVGLVMVVLLVAFMISQTKKENKRLFVSFFPLFGWIIFTMSGQLITSGNALLELVLIFVTLAVYEKKEEDNN